MQSRVRTRSGRSPSICIILVLFIKTPYLFTSFDITVYEPMFGTETPTDWKKSPHKNKQNSVCFVYCTVKCFMASGRYNSKIGSKHKNKKIMQDYFLSWNASFTVYLNLLTKWSSLKPRNYTCYTDCRNKKTLHLWTF